MKEEVAEVKEEMPCQALDEVAMKLENMAEDEKEYNQNGAMEDEKLMEDENEDVEYDEMLLENVGSPEDLHMCHG